MGISPSKHDRNCNDSNGNNSTISNFTNSNHSKSNKTCDRANENSKESMECDLFESLVDELLKAKPDSRKVKALCCKLGIMYIKNQADQIEDLLKNGSQIYLKTRLQTPESKRENAESL